MSDEKSDSDDWFNKDEDELVQDLKNKANLNDNKTDESSTEYITNPQAPDEYLQDKRLQAAETKAQPSKTYAKLSKEALRKLATMSPLDTFLSAWTYERNFFVDQISLRDTQERVFSYLRVIFIIYELKLPYFEKDLLQHFVDDAPLLERLQIVATKLFVSKYEKMWRDSEQVDEFMVMIGSLLVRAHSYRLITPKALELVIHTKKLMESKDVSICVAQREACKLFAEQLDRIHAGEKEERVHIANYQQVYPTLKELVLDDSKEEERKCAPNDISDFERNSIKEEEIKLTENINDAILLKRNFNGEIKAEADTSVDVDANKSIAQYIETQLNIIRESFILPLRECVRVLKQTKCLDTLTHPILYEDVEIVLNMDFINSCRHEMVFVDVFGTNVKEKRNLSILKNGALLCLTTSTDFENLILAKITYTDPNLLRLGYIGIELVCQYNIGKVYGTKFLMFETPSFFEAYSNVYNYLSTCEVNRFPMERYIVYGEKNVHTPLYLEPDRIYKYEGESFNPLKGQTTLKKLPLNPSQTTAYFQALSKELCLIQGPPGTGKTHLSDYLVRTLIENATNPIVLITYTNESLDKFLLKLSAYTQNIIRFGSQTRLKEIEKFNIPSKKTDGSNVNPKLKRLYYIINEEFKNEFEILQKLHLEFDGSEESYQNILVAQSAVSALSEKLNCIRIMFQYYIARKASLIAMTTTFAARTNFLLRLLQSKIVIFEEAAEIMESHVLACLTPYTQHVIFIGDHMQLRPFNIHNNQQKGSYSPNISLFERLMKQQLESTSILNVQYRMRPCIAELICPVIYSDLKNGITVETYPNVRKMQKNLYFVEHEENETKSVNENSICNNFEVEQISKLATFLFETAEYTPEDIAILSPYAQQVACIKEKLTNFEETQKITVATVDSYQGLEANIVLLSLVRSNKDQQIGFLKEINRICVALSRAKHGLYMIGNLKLLASCSGTWNSVKKTLLKQDALGSCFPYQDIIN